MFLDPWNAKHLRTKIENGVFYTNSKKGTPRVRFIGPTPILNCGLVAAVTPLIKFKQDSRGSKSNIMTSSYPHLVVKRSLSCSWRVRPRCVQPRSNERKRRDAIIGGRKQISLPHCSEIRHNIHVFVCAA